MPAADILDRRPSVYVDAKRDQLESAPLRDALKSEGKHKSRFFDLLRSDGDVEYIAVDGA